MERNSIKEKIIARLVFFTALALLVWGALSYFTSPLVPLLHNRRNTAINFLILTKPAMLISYNPSLKKGIIINLTDKESALPVEEISKHFQLENTPYIFIPNTQNRKIFWDNFKESLSVWPKKPYKVLSYVYSYLKMRLTKKTFISIGDFILISYELPHVRGVDFTVKEMPKTQKTKAKMKQKTIKHEDNKIILENTSQSDEILVVEVLNASNHNGLASDVARYLRTLNNEGIFKVDVINFGTSNERQDKTKIVALTKRLDTLKELSKHLGLTDTEIHYTEDKNAICEAKIYLGEDFKLPNTAK
ncbi:MAG: LytR C-terminal domain-containing protein [Elusimicrobiaceae bacterium]|nr:LytR C-terminal domain-containing protein [Elusimicrobiaceae bacterium]